MNEWIMILVMVICVGLFPSGGTDVPKIGGQKWLRRILMAFLIGLIGAVNSTWWQGVGYSLTMFGILTCPYGDRTPYWLKFIVFTGYGAGSLWFGYSWWLAVTPIVCISLFALSNWEPTAKSFPWKVCEGIFGFTIAASMIASLLNRW